MYSIIEKSLAKSFSYEEFRNHVSALLEQGKSTGNDQTEELLHYSELNKVRMNRLDKTMVVPDFNVDKLQSIKKEYLWLVIAEGWCGDVAQILPIINKMAEFSDKIDLRIVLRDENSELMDMFLTNGNRSIPKLIIIDNETTDVVCEWGARPKGAKQLIMDYKAKFGVVDLTAKTELQKWYHDDKGLSTQEEIIEIMESL